MVSSSLEVIGLLTHLFTPDGVAKAVIAAGPRSGRDPGPPFTSAPGSSPHIARGVRGMRRRRVRAPSQHSKQSGQEQTERVAGGLA